MKEKGKSSPCEIKKEKYSTTAWTFAFLKGYFGSNFCISQGKKRKTGWKIEG